VLYSGRKRRATPVTDVPVPAPTQAAQLGQAAPATALPATVNPALANTAPTGTKPLNVPVPGSNPFMS
jgi:hypothetical protein